MKNEKSKKMEKFQKNRKNKKNYYNFFFFLLLFRTQTHTIQLHCKTQMRGAKRTEIY